MAETNEKIEELAKRYQAGESMSLCELSRLIRNRQGLSESVQAQLAQETEQPEYYYSRSKRRKERRQQKQAE